MVRPFYCLEYSLVECRCACCGGLIARGLLKLVVLRRGLFVRSWRRLNYCVECAPHVLCKQKLFCADKTVKRDCGVGVLYDCMEEVNLRNGYA